MSNPTTPFGWQMPTATDLVTDLPADFEVFGQAVATSMADLLGGTTGQVLKKNTNADMDFVWSADAAGMTNPMTTTGDTIYSSPGSTPARLGIGSAGQVLTVASGVPAWTTPASSGGMTLLSTTTLSGSSVSINVTPTGYVALKVYIKQVYGTSNDGFYLRINGDSGSNYSYGLMRGGPSAVTSASNIYYAYMSQGSETSGSDVKTLTNAEMNIDFPNATDSIYINHCSINGPGSDMRFTFCNGIYDCSAALSSISFTTFGGSFSGGTVYVYGVK